MEIEESNLIFEFNNETQAIKFDDTKSYRQFCNKMPSSKGVDILADSKEMIQFIEIKNCTGHENENMWRTSINNSKLSAAPRDLDVDDRDSLDIEVTKKVASTISCLLGAWRKSEKSEKTAEIAGFWKGVSDSKIVMDKKQLLVVLFLEGDFVTNAPKSRSKKAIMKRLQESMNVKLSWLNCKVMVVDSDTYKERYLIEQEKSKATIRMK